MAYITYRKVVKLAILINVCFACVEKKGEGEYVKDTIKRNIKERVDKKFSVGTVAIFIENGKEEYFCYGYSDTDSKRRVNAKSVFEIGSISKTFTGLLLADLVEKGKLKLDDPEFSSSLITA